METFRELLKWIWGFAILAFWLWGCENNDGFVAIGVPAVVIMYAIATSDSKGSGSNDPRGGPWDGG